MNTGAMHVLAVSGLHVGLILYLLLFIAERFSKYVSKKNALIAILLFLWIYALVTGMSPSVIRAVFMFSMLSLSQLSSRDYSPINILFFTAFVLLVYNPLYIFDIGFQLSYLAMLGIFLFYPKIEAVFSVDNWLMKKIWQGTTIGLAAQILTTPLSLYYFHQFPNYFMLSNLGLMATSGIILGLGISILAVAKIPFLVKPFTVLLWLVLFCTLYFLSFIEKLPGAVAYGYDLIVWQGLMVIVASLILFYSRSVKYKLFIAVPLLLFSISWISFNRYERMSDDEICVFSNSKPLISLKKNGVVHCFYKSTSPKDFEKAAMIMSSYTKLYPGKLVFHELKKQSVLVEDANDIIAIEPKDGNYRLKVNNKEYTLVLKSGLKTDDYFDSFRIGMPWVEGGVNHSLRDGAYQIQL
jgi:competence protein ComEC